MLTDKQIVGLVTTGRTPLVKGFRNREGRSFDAALVLNPDFTVGYSFPDRKPRRKKRQEEHNPSGIVSLNNPIII